MYKRQAIDNVIFPLVHLVGTLIMTFGKTTEEQRHTKQCAANQNNARLYHNRMDYFRIAQREGRDSFVGKESKRISFCMYFDRVHGKERHPAGHKHQNRKIGGD